MGIFLIAESMDEAISIANEIASEHLEIQTKNPYDVMTKIRNAGAILSVNIPVNRWAIILQVRTMYFRQMEPQNFSPRCPWMILSKNQVLSLIQKRHWRKYMKILKASQQPNGLPLMPILSMYDLIRNRRISYESNCKM